MSFPVNFPKLSGAIFFAGHIRTATYECSLIRNFSEKKTLNYKSKGNNLKLKFY